MDISAAHRRINSSLIQRVSVEYNAPISNLSGYGIAPCWPPHSPYALFLSPPFLLSPSCVSLTSTLTEETEKALLSHSIQNLNLKYSCSPRANFFACLSICLFLLLPFSTIKPFKNAHTIYLFEIFIWKYYCLQTAITLFYYLLSPPRFYLWTS